MGTPGILGVTLGLGDIRDHRSRGRWGHQSGQAEGTAGGHRGALPWVTGAVGARRSFGVVLWELLTGEIPYKDVDSSAIIWGVGSNSLHLPVPSSCPDGFKVLLRQCW